MCGCAGKKRQDGGDHDIDVDVDGLGGRLAATSLGAGTFSGASSYQSPPVRSRPERKDGGGGGAAGGDQRLPAAEEEEAAVEEGAREDDGYCGLGQAGDYGGWDEEEEVVETNGMDTQVLGGWPGRGGREGKGSTTLPVRRASA